MNQDPREILKKIRRIELRTRRLVNASFSGRYHSVFKGRGMNFEEVREYTAGDDIRTIDWNVTARMNAPYVKKFTEERELTVMLLVDVSASGSFGSVELSKRELAAEVAAILAFSAINNSDKVGLLLFSDDVELFIAPKKGRLHTLRLIREMLYFQPRGKQTNLAAALEYLNTVMSRRAVVFLISDFLAPDYTKPLTVSAGVTMWSRCRSSTRGGAPAGRGPGDFRGCGNRRTDRNQYLQLVGSDAFAAEEERGARGSTNFGSHGFDVVPLATNQDYLVALRAFFERRKRRLAA